MLAITISATACEAGTTAVDCENDVDVPLLRLEANETASVAGRSGDAWILEVETHGGDVVDALAGHAEMPAVVARRVVAVEGCEATPRTIGDGLASVHAPPREGLPWIAESDGSIGTSPPLWRIDPDGRDSPVQITGRYSNVVWVEDGAFVVDAADETGGSLVRVRETGDGISATVEREGVLRLSVADQLPRERVALVTTEDDLVVRDVASGEETLVRPGVGGVWSSDVRSRFLMLYTAVEERAMVVDVDEATAIELIDGAETDFVGRWMTAGSSQSQVYRDDGAVESQVVLFPELRDLRFDGDWKCTDCTRKESDAMVLRGPDGLYLLGDGSDVPVQLRPVRGEGFIADGHVYAFEDVPPSVPADAGRNSLRLVRLDLDGSNAVDLLLGERATDIVRLSDDRWAYSRIPGFGMFGELVVMDTATTAREEVADDAMSYLYDRVGAEPEDTDELAYFAVSDDPDRHGIWIAHVDRLFD